VRGWVIFRTVRFEHYKIVVWRHLRDRCFRNRSYIYFHLFRKLHSSMRFTMFSFSCGCGKSCVKFKQKPYWWCDRVLKLQQTDQVQFANILLYGSAFHIHVQLVAVNKSMSCFSFFQTLKLRVVSYSSASSLNCTTTFLCDTCVGRDTRVFFVNSDLLYTNVYQEFKENAVTRQCTVDRLLRCFHHIWIFWIPGVFLWGTISLKWMVLGRYAWCNRILY